MEKLLMCRICLAENVRMYVVVNRHLHELYEKLTDIPFVTKESRPMLACFFCCAKLKQCYRLLRQCLQAEELFTQMMNEDYEPSSLINKNHFEFVSGFIKSPIEHISIDDECQTESIAINEELPAVCEALDDIIIEPKEEYEIEELKPENLDNSCLYVADVPAHNCESDLEADEPLLKLKSKLEPENLDNSCLYVADVPAHNCESDLEADEPLLKLKIEVEEEQEVSKKKRRASETRRATVGKYPKLNIRSIRQAAEQTKKDKSDSKVTPKTEKRTSKRGTSYKQPYKFGQCTRTTKQEDAITAKQTKKDKSHSKVIPTTEKCTSKRGTSVKEPNKYEQRSDRKQIGEKPFKCDVCQRSFAQKGNLTKHIRTHTGEKPYKCDICQRSFTLKCILTQHIRIHTGLKPYKCDVCQRSFTRKDNLTQHIGIHTGVKPFKCDVCQRSYIQKGTLTKHIRIHTGEKPYKCDICQRSFTLKCILTQHIRIHTGEKPHKCFVCQRSFSRKAILRKHFWNTHW